MKRSSSATSPETATSAPTIDGAIGQRARRGELEEVSREWDGEDDDVRGEQDRREQEHGGTAPRPFGLERHDQVEADEDQRRGGDRSRGGHAEVEDVEGGEIAREDAEAGRRACREREARELAQEAVRGVRAAARRERQEEAGNADRQRSGERELARKQWVGRGRQPDRQDEEAGERRLRHEQLRDALDVPQDLPALGDHRRHRGEVVLDEHDVRHGARHLGAGALRDREVRRLERRHVVDAVAHHRDVRAGGAKLLDEPPLVMWSDASEHRVVEHEPPQLLRSAGSSEASTATPSIPASRAIEATVSRRSPDSTFSSTPWARNQSTVSRAWGRSRSERKTSAPARGRSASRRSDVPKASTRRPSARAASAAAVERPELEVLGSAEHVADAADPLGAEAPLSTRTGSDRRRARAQPGTRRRSPRAWRCGPRPSPRSGRGRPPSTPGREAAHPQSRLGQGAGLVETDHVDRRERFDRVELLCERSPARHAQRSDRVGEAREQHEPFRDQRDDRRDRRRHRRVQRVRGDARARSRGRSPAAPAPRRG